MWCVRTGGIIVCGRFARSLRRMRRKRTNDKRPCRSRGAGGKKNRNRKRHKARGVSSIDENLVRDSSPACKRRKCLPSRIKDHGLLIFSDKTVLSSSSQHSPARPGGCVFRSHVHGCSDTSTRTHTHTHIQTYTLRINHTHPAHMK